MRITRAITPAWGVAPIRYLGGKARRIRWFRPFFRLEPYTTYAEPYGGSAVILLTIAAAYPHLTHIIYNDIDGELAGLMRLLQDPVRFPQHWTQLKTQLYAQHSIRDALRQTDPTRLLIFHNMGMGGMRTSNEGSFGRGFISGAGISATVSSSLAKRGMLPTCHTRLQRVTIHHTDALAIINQYDHPDAFLYCDPPYHPDTRKGGEYTHEVDAQHHWQLMERLLRAKAGIILSGYPHEDYQALETAGWKRYDLQTACFAAARTRSSPIRGIGNAIRNAPRTESIWISPRHLTVLSA